MNDDDEESYPWVKPGTDDADDNWNGYIDIEGGEVIAKVEEKESFCPNRVVSKCTLFGDSSTSLKTTRPTDY